MAGKPDLVSRLKTGVEIVREALIVCLIIVVVAFPKITASVLSRYGFDTVKTPIGDVSLAKILGAGGGVETAQRSVSDAASALNNLKTSLPASAQVQLDDVVKHLDSTVGTLTASGQLLTTAAKAKADTQTSEQQRQGWIYLGQVNDSNNRWIARPPIVTNTPPLKAGDTMTIAADVYVGAIPLAARQTRHLPGLCGPASVFK